MQWMEIQNVECGECIVLGGKKRDILMVDCGSSNNKIRDGSTDFPDYVENGIMRRYRGMDSRAFLLTHCHRDHVCGLWQILKTSPSYFNRYYLPTSPCDKSGRPLLLEYALFVYVFLNRLTGYSKVNICELELLSRVAKAAGADSIYTVRAGDTFDFDDVTYEVLWPEETDFPFPPIFASAVEDLNVCLSSPFLPATASEFLRLKDQFCTVYSECCKCKPLREEHIAELDAILNRITDLIPQLLLLPCTADAADILNNSVTQTAYSDAMNAASVIFQNRRENEASMDDILMTGDAPPESLEAVADRLYDGYYAIKAPHHGTANFYSPLLAEIGVSHIIISNGEYRQGGQIAEEYADCPAVKHCTSHDACPWYRQSGSSCNRLACCYELSPRPGLTIKCSVYRSGDKFYPCIISVLSPSGRRACLCDERASDR
jgi:hypothetical protein